MAFLPLMICDKQCDTQALVIGVPFPVSAVARILFLASVVFPVTTFQREAIIPFRLSRKGAIAASRARRASSVSPTMERSDRKFRTGKRL